MKPPSVPAYFLGVLLLIGAYVVVSYESVDRTQSKRDSESGQQIPEIRASPEHRQKSPLPAVASNRAMPSSGGPGGATVGDHQNEQNVSQNLRAAAHVDSSGAAMIGRPFPVSESIERNCRRMATGGVDGCGEVHDALLALAQEPRDPVWAMDMEARLAALVSTRDSNAFIRSLECRTSRCALEVASVSGAFRDPEYDYMVQNGISPSYGAFSYEKDPSSATMTVSLLTFLRRR